MEIKVLTYNIFWKSSTGVENYEEICSNDKCLNNIIKFIDKYFPYDFVGLQEASSWKYIRKNSKLREMQHRSLIIDRENIVLFWNNKHSLDQSHNYLIGHFKSEGRPIQMFFFDENLCVINIHAGHNYDFFKIDMYIMRILNNINLLDRDIYLEKLKHYQIIILGDFNEGLEKSKLKFLNRQFYEKKTKPTCCDTTLTGRKKKTKISDHIISTKKIIEAHTFNLKYASDHNPVIAYININ